MLEEFGIGDKVESVDELAGILEDVFTDWEQTDSTDETLAPRAATLNVPCNHPRSRYVKH